jgi:hypothetical protein
VTDRKKFITFFKFFIHPVNYLSQNFFNHIFFQILHGKTRAFDIGILSRFRYFDIENFQFRDSDINSDIGNIQIDEEI